MCSVFTMHPVHGAGNALKCIVTFWQNTTCCSLQVKEAEELKRQQANLEKLKLDLPQQQQGAT